MTTPLLTDEQCDEFRRLPVSFNDMVRAIHQAGHAAARAEAEALLRELLEWSHLDPQAAVTAKDWDDLLARIDAYLKGDTNA